MKHRIGIYRNKRHEGRPWFYAYTLRYRGTVQRMAWIGPVFVIVRNKVAARNIVSR
jgi:hypothetical protein